MRLLAVCGHTYSEPNVDLKLSNIYTVTSLFHSPTVSGNSSVMIITASFRWILSNALTTSVKQVSGNLAATHFITSIVGLVLSDSLVMPSNFRISSFGISNLKARFFQFSTAGIVRLSLSAIVCRSFDPGIMTSFSSTSSAIKKTH